jgi:hypothetical protein
VLFDYFIPALPMLGERGKAGKNWQWKSEKAFRYDQDIAWSHGYVGRNVAILDQIVQADAELLLFPVYVANDAGLVSGGEVRNATHCNQDIHQRHFIAVG